MFKSFIIQYTKLARCIFSVLIIRPVDQTISNYDSHGKNVSFFYDANENVFTPVDIINSRL